MIALYIVLLICVAALIFGSYHMVVNETVWGAWMVGISAFVMFAVLLGFVMFR